MNDKQEEKRDMKALKIIWLFFIIGILNACTADDIVSSDSNGRDENAATEIAISLDDLLPVNMNSRNTNIDGLLSQINDLNIRVKVGGKNTFIYCPSKEKLYIDGKLVTSTKTYYIDRNMLNIHCNDISAKQVEQVEVIANNGKMILEDDVWKNVVEQGDDNLNNGYCMMYGSTDASKDNKHNGEQGALDCRLFTVKLQRTRAMLTVQLNGEGLKEGVSITPTKISLHNVPTQCTLLSENATTEKNRIDGEVQAIDWGTLTNKTTVVGAHNNSGSQEDFLPLYLFENLQGVNDNTSSSQKVTKYPQGCNNVADAKNNKTHSYVEIEAEYKYEEGGYLKNNGTIVYRFFLGENDYNDFNVKRNTYYRLTLNLKGFGGASEDGKVEDGKLIVNENDLSWRVDMDITDWGFEKDAYTFDAHASFGYFEIMGSDWQVTTKGEEQWVRFYLSAPQSGVNWTENVDSRFKVGNEGKLYYYIEPYYYIKYSGKNYNYNSYRTSSVTLTKDGETKTVTFTQYVPIKIEVDSKTIVYMERFEEESQHKWGCIAKTITEALSLTGQGRPLEDYGAENFKYVENSGSNLDDTKRNTLYMYYAALNNKFKSDAHSYCIEKSGKGYMNEPKVASVNASSDENIYCLPSEAIFTAMKNFDFSKLEEGSYEPIWSNEDYWVSNINRTDNTSTYWNGQGYVNGDRNTQKRIRAIYIDYWSNNK